MIFHRTVNERTWELAMRKQKSRMTHGEMDGCILRRRGWRELQNRLKREVQIEHELGKGQRVCGDHPFCWLPAPPIVSLYVKSLSGFTRYVQSGVRGPVDLPWWSHWQEIGILCFFKGQRLAPVFIYVISDEFPSLSLFPVRRLVKEVNACK